MLPLGNLSVVELGSSLQAPYAVEVLTEFDAKAIKVEFLEGDDASWRRRPPLKDALNDEQFAIQRSIARMGGNIAAEAIGRTATECEEYHGLSRLCFPE